MATGFAEAFSLFDRVPQEARAKLGELLVEFGLETSAAQKAAVAKRTGYLEEGLGWEALVDELRARIGLLKFKSGRNSRYYGRFVEFGRRAQTVVLRRLQVGARSEWRRRIAAGTATSRAKPNDLLAKKRTMRITALPARPFVHLPDADVRLARRTANFWNEVLGA